MADVIDDEGWRGPSTQMVGSAGAARPGRERCCRTGVEQELQVVLPAVAVFDAEQDPLEPPRALPAGRALAAGLPGEELGDPPGGPHHAGVRSSMTVMAPEPSIDPAAHLVLAQRQVQVLGEEPGGGDAAGDDGLEGVCGRGVPPAEHGGVDEVREGGLGHLQLEDARVADVAREGEEPGPGGAARGRGGGACFLMEDDPRQVRTGPRRVVDHGGVAVEADEGGEVRGAGCGGSPACPRATRAGRSPRRRCRPRPPGGPPRPPRTPSRRCRCRPSPRP